MIRSLFAICMLPALMVAIGCGGGGGGNKITGKVTYQGKPVDGGSITFEVNGRPYYGSIEKGGIYTAHDVPSGTAKVAISSSPPAVGPDDPPPDPSTYVTVPDKYANAETSGLTYEVQSGDQTHDIELK